MFVVRVNVKANFSDFICDFSWRFGASGFEFWLQNFDRWDFERKDE